MAGPSWLAGAFAALMVVTAAYCASRLAISRLRSRATELDADALHAVMGAAMAGMLVPQLNILPGRAWAAVFGIWAAWFGWHATGAPGPGIPGSTRCRFPVPHLIECIAMIYMLLPLHDASPQRAGGGMTMAGTSASASPAGSFPALAVVLALFMLGYIVWTTDRLAALVRAGATTADPGGRREPQQAAAIPAAARPHHHGGALVAPAASSTRRAASITRYSVPAGKPALAPALAAFGKIAMSITMGYMLILML